MTHHTVCGLCHANLYKGKLATAEKCGKNGVDCVFFKRAEEAGRVDAPVKICGVYGCDVRTDQLGTPESVFDCTGLSSLGCLHYHKDGGVDPSGKDPHEMGAKLDAGKVNPAYLCLRYFPNAIKALAYVSDYGTVKYVEMSWQEVENGYRRYTEAMVRHLLTELGGEALDQESGLYHAAQVAWNAMARLELAIRSGDVSLDRMSEVVALARTGAALAEIPDENLN